jgi:hypothetical protein
MQVKCPNCGALREPEVVNAVPRPACSKCGDRRIAVELGRATEVNVADSFDVGFSPDQLRDWKGRWRDAQEQLNGLDVPQSDQLSGRGRP